MMMPITPVDLFNPLHDISFVGRHRPSVRLSQRGSEGFDPSQRLVSFAPVVSVREIPSRNDMPEDLKNLLWTLDHEFNFSLARNYLEWQADDNNLQHAKEESDFVQLEISDDRCLKHTLLVHPATYKWWERASSFGKAKIEAGLVLDEQQRLRAKILSVRNLKALANSSVVEPCIAMSCPQNEICPLQTTSEGKRETRIPNDALLHL